MDLGTCFSELLTFYYTSELCGEGLLWDNVLGFIAVKCDLLPRICLG